MKEDFKNSDTNIIVSCVVTNKCTYKLQPVVNLGDNDVNDRQQHQQQQQQQQQQSSALLCNLYYRKLHLIWMGGPSWISQIPYINEEK
jgi:hypothetical protein